MAADNTATKCATSTLVANTNLKLNLTGPGKTIELIHHGGAATQVVYYDVAATEAGLLALAGGGADNEYPLLPGERLQVNAKRGRAGADVGIWIMLRSTGTPVVSAQVLVMGS